MKTDTALRLVPSEPKPCKYPGCVTGFAVRPNVSPGEFGYCSDICRQFDAMEREVRGAMHNVGAGLGFGP